MEFNQFQADTINGCIGHVAYGEEGQPKIVNWEHHKNPLAMGVWLILDNGDRIWQNLPRYPKSKGVYKKVK